MRKIWLSSKWRASWLLISIALARSRPIGFSTTTRVNALSESGGLISPPAFSPPNIGR